MEPIDDYRYRLSTGREFYANGYVVGLGPDYLDSNPGYSVTVPQGWDGSINIREAAWADDTSEDWTPDECAELADYMINLWQQWRAEMLKPKPNGASA